MKVSVMKDKDNKKVMIGDNVSKVPAINLDAVVGKDDPHLSDKTRTPGASFGDAASALVAKRLIKRGSQRNSDRRESLHYSSNQSQQQPTSTKVEPTYQLEPKSVFSACAVEKILKNVLEHRLKGKTYDPIEIGELSRLLADEIKERVKMLKYDRYKIVSYVTMGENTGQGVMATSRCAWDPERDSYASFTQTTKELFCTACVFGIYTE